MRRIYRGLKNTQSESIFLPPIPQFKKFPQRFTCFIHAHRLHAAQIDRAFAQVAWAAFDQTTKDAMVGAQRAGVDWLSGTKDGGHACSDRGREMHGPRIVA